AARLEDMDTMGIDAAVLHPTLFNEYLPIVENPQLAAVLARAYNDWILDLCQAEPDRLLPVAVLPLQNALEARRELIRVAELGFTSVLLRPMFYAVAVDRPVAAALALQGGGMGPTLPDGMEAIFLDDPYYRTVWDEMAERDLVACIHPSPGSTNPNGVSAGTFIERVATRLGIGHRVAETVAGIQDNAVFVTAACYHGLLEDYPNLRMALLHGSASMTPLTLEKSETYLWLGTGGDELTNGAPVSLEPEHVFEDHPVVVSFPSWETSVGRLAAKVPAIGHKAAWGSRYPQHDASDPKTAIDMLCAHHVDAELQAGLMGGHADALFRLGMAAPVTT
ncbi:MAG TPA: amidohydrolase family protein, partial [Acidimicrobiales bacterium]